MQERSGETIGILSTDEVGELSECFLLLTNSDMKTKSEMENRYVHAPSQRVQKLRHFITHSIP